MFNLTPLKLLAIRERLEGVAPKMCEVLNKLDSENALAKGLDEDLTEGFSEGLGMEIECYEQSSLTSHFFLIALKGALHSHITFFTPFAAEVVIRALKEKLEIATECIKYKEYSLSFKEIEGLGKGLDSENECSEVFVALSEALCHILWHYEAKCLESKGIA